MKKTFKQTLFVSLLASLMLPSLSAREVVDMAGRTVTLPDTPITKVADAWFAHATAMMALGAGEKMIATVNRPENSPWMFKVLPSLNHAILGQGKLFNLEELVGRGTELVFVANNNPQQEAMEKMHLPVVNVHFTTLDSMQKSLLTTAEALGNPENLKRAKDYNAYLKAQLDKLQLRFADLKESDRPKVLHISSLNPLKVDGKNTLIDDWIRLAGGQNAVTIKGNMQAVNAEQILEWMPDLIILQGNAGDLTKSPAYPLLKNLDAVKTNKVFRNPRGVFYWDRYGVESALQIQWAAQIFHPQKASGEKMTAITQDFYQRFFNYPLTEKEALRILNAQAPEAN